MILNWANILFGALSHIQQCWWGMQNRESKALPKDLPCCLSFPWLPPWSERNSIIIITDIITLTIISISRISPVWLFPDCLLALSSARLIAGSGSGRMQCALCLYLLLNLHVEVMYHWSLCIMQFNAMVRRMHSVCILIPSYLNQHVGVFMYYIFTSAFSWGSCIIMLTSVMQC